METMTLEEMADVVPIKNRLVNGPVKVIRDAKEFTWEAGETKLLPRQVAWFVISKSTRKRDLKGKEKVQLLVIVGGGKPESDLKAESFAGPQELVEKQWFDRDGTPLRAVYLDVNGTGVEDIVNRVESKEAAKYEELKGASREKSFEKLQPLAAKAADAIEADEAAEKAAQA
jgi:hypothetical protein